MKRREFISLLGGGAAAWPADASARELFWQWLQLAQRSLIEARERRARAAGSWYPIEITSATRSEALPDVPTVSEFVPGYEASFWFGVGAPKATPAEIVEKLNKEVNAGLADPKIKARLADVGGTALSGSPADFGRLIADETEKWAKVVKFTGIKAE